MLMSQIFSIEMTAALPHRKFRRDFIIIRMTFFKIVLQFTITYLVADQTDYYSKYNAVFFSKSSSYQIWLQKYMHR